MLFGSLKGGPRPELLLRSQSDGKSGNNLKQVNGTVVATSSSQSVGASSSALKPVTHVSPKTTVSSSAPLSITGSRPLQWGNPEDRAILKSMQQHAWHRRTDEDIKNGMTIFGFSEDREYTEFVAIKPEEREQKEALTEMVRELRGEDPQPTTVQSTTAGEVQPTKPKNALQASRKMT